MAVKFQSYPGTRDFYPADMAFRNWMFQVQRDVCARYSYQEYAAPILESTDLYRSKSSEEIVNEQLYTFTDRGDREVSVRPEMTPTLARLAVNRPNNYLLPLRWFSIANFMRYERPGKGRLREFYQLNVDLLGATGVAADAEILMIAVDLMLAYGASPDDFIVRISDRRLLDLWINIDDKEKLRSIGRLIDKKEKITEAVFHDELQACCNDTGIEERVRSYLSLHHESLSQSAEQIIKAHPNADQINTKELTEVLQHLSGVRSLLDATGFGKSVRFDPAIVRGFDYYTGLVFEIYDTNTENRRAIFGGGRYDRLLGQFGKTEIAAVGFGMGDVTLQAFLEGHGLQPAEGEKHRVFFSLMNESFLTETMQMASKLRSKGVEVEVMTETTKKFGKQLELAEKRGFRFVLILGEDEIKSGKIILKDLKASSQKQLPLTDIVTAIQSAG